MKPRALIIERTIRVLTIERGGAASIKLERGTARELVIERSGLPGRPGNDGIVANPPDILDYINTFDGSLT